jgi:hypothetical protein
MASTTPTRFPDIAAAVAKLSARSLVLDGEVCVFDAQSVSQFHVLGDQRHDWPRRRCSWPSNCSGPEDAISDLGHCPTGARHWKT